MRKNILFLPLLLLGILFFITNACEKDEEGDVCESFDAQCGAPDLATACIDENDNSYYTYNGKRYDCNGDDCDDAMEQLLKDMCPDISYERMQELQISLSNLTLKLMNEVRVTNL